jgi:hypothetical protein
MYKFRRILGELFFFHIVLFNSACTSFKSIDCTISDERYQNIKMYIPRYKKSQTILAGGEAGKDCIFWYKDSCAIYVSYASDGATLNYENIRNQSGSYGKRFIADSILLEGVDQFGKYWKEYKKDRIFIGYYRVNSHNKNEFDKALQSFELVKKKGSILK